MNHLFEIVFTAEFVGNALRYSTPIMIAALGLVVNERAGILNLSAEGIILVAAFFAFIISYFSGSAVLGLLGAVLFSVILAMVHAFCSIALGLNQVIVAVALNMFSLGLTNSLLRILLGTKSHVIRSPGFGLFPWPESFLKIPILSDILFRQHFLTYLAFIMVPVIWVAFYKTTWGLKIRAAGEYPKAADSMGIGVQKVRYMSMLFSGVMSGLAGASLSITGLNLFIENMSGGYGFIAFACIVFGRFNPIGAAAGALLFGFVTSLQLRMQTAGTGIPYQIPLMLPYLITIIMLGFLGSGTVPKAWAVPYSPDEE